MRRRTKMMEPMKPPAMVMYSEPPSCWRKICIVANRTTARVADTVHDTPVGRAATKNTKL